MVDFKGSKIKGVILSRIKKEVYPLFKEQIEKYVGIKVLGFIEEDRNLKIESKYLGLVDPVEYKSIEKRIDDIEEFIRRNI
jgi:cobyrinic acid a,c-diamide synthase